VEGPEDEVEDSSLVGQGQGEARENVGRDKSRGQRSGMEQYPDYE
jgi:hypothetical protein